MHLPALPVMAALLASVSQAFARVHCYDGGRDFQASADSLRNTFRQICQDNFGFFPTTQSAALACYNYDSVSKINFLVRYEGPNSKQGLNAGDCEREFFDIAEPCSKGGENKNEGSGFFFRYVTGVYDELEDLTDDGLVLIPTMDSVRRRTGIPSYMKDTGWILLSY